MQLLIKTARNNTSVKASGFRHCREKSEICKQKMPTKVSVWVFSYDRETNFGNSYWNSMRLTSDGERTMMSHKLMLTK